MIHLRPTAIIVTTPLWKIVQLNMLKKTLQQNTQQIEWHSEKS